MFQPNYHQIRLKGKILFTHWNMLFATAKYGNASVDFCWTDVVTMM